MVKFFIAIVVFAIILMMMIPAFSYVIVPFIIVAGIVCAILDFRSKAGFGSKPGSGGGYTSSSDDLCPHCHRIHRDCCTRYT